jgi:hypothetical protein
LAPLVQEKQGGPISPFWQDGPSQALKLIYKFRPKMFDDKASPWPVL